MKEELEITLADQIAFDSSKGLYGDWSRSLSKRIFTDLVKASSQSIDVVFAANDEMALGVFDSIKKLKSKKSHHHRKVASCLVYGFDAIDEMVKRISDNDPNLKGTIEQPAGAMAKALVKLLSQALKEGFAAVRPSGKDGKTCGEKVNPVILIAELTPESKQLPALSNDGNWKTTKEMISGKRILPKYAYFFNSAGTAIKYDRNLSSATHQSDDCGEFGSQGSRKPRHYRIKDKVLFWWIGDPVWKVGGNILSKESTQR